MLYYNISIAIVIAPAFTDPEEWSPDHDGSEHPADSTVGFAWIGAYSRPSDVWRVLRDRETAYIAAREAPHVRTGFVRKDPSDRTDRLSRRRQDHVAQPHPLRAARQEIRRHRQRIRRDRHRQRSRRRRRRGS